MNENFKIIEAFILMILIDAEENNNSIDANKAREAESALSRIRVKFQSIQVPNCKPEPTEFTKKWHQRLENAVALYKMGRPTDDWFQSIVTGFREACDTIDRQAEEYKRLKEVLEMKSYDLLLPGNKSGREDAYCCSLCGSKPHTKNCVYGQALKGGENDK